MKCSDVLEIIKSVQPIATIIVAFISAYLAYKNTIKNSINQEKIKEYSEILDMLYELKSNTSIFLHNTEYIEREQGENFAIFKQKAILRNRHNLF